VRPLGKENGIFPFFCHLLSEGLEDISFANSFKGGRFWFTWDGSITYACMLDFKNGLSKIFIECL
jgi:hypothetical protein